MNIDKRTIDRQWQPQAGSTILAQGVMASFDDYTSGLNDNILVVGGSGTGKTRGVVRPNLLQATGSYIVSDPKGRHYMYPHARVMIHEAYLAGGVGGSTMSIQNTAAEMLRTQQIVNEILAAHTDRTTGEVERAVAYDHFMNAGEAIAFGICDAIVGAGGDDRTNPC